MVVTIATASPALLMPQRVNHVRRTVKTPRFLKHRPKSRQRPNTPYTTWSLACALNPLPSTYSSRIFPCSRLTRDRGGAWYIIKIEMTLEQKLEKLPPYLYCDEPECKDQRHYLTFNRDIQGKWCVGYVEFLYHTGIHTDNSYDTLEAAIEAVAHELDITLTCFSVHCY